MKLKKEAIELQKDVVEALQKRFRAGFTIQAKLLRQQIVLARLQNEARTLEMELRQKRLQLQSYAALDSVPKIEEFLYESFEPSNVVDWQSKILQKEKNLWEKRAQSVQDFDVFFLALEMEKEPERTIARASLALQLPLFGKKEQRLLAFIRARKKALQLMRQQKAFEARVQNLVQSIKTLQRMIAAQKRLVSKQKELFGRYLEGFKDGSIELLALLKAKEQLIAQKEEIIRLQERMNEQIIEYETLKYRL